MVIIIVIPCIDGPGVRCLENLVLNPGSTDTLASVVLDTNLGIQVYLHRHFTECSFDELTRQEGKNKGLAPSMCNWELDFIPLERCQRRTTLMDEVA